MIGDPSSGDGSISSAPLLCADPPREVFPAVLLSGLDVPVIAIPSIGIDYRGETLVLTSPAEARQFTETTWIGLFSFAESSPESGQTGPDNLFFSDVGHPATRPEEIFSEIPCRRPGCRNAFRFDPHVPHKRFCGRECYETVRLARKRLLHWHRLTGCLFAGALYRLLGGLSGNAA